MSDGEAGSEGNPGTDGEGQISLEDFNALKESVTQLKSTNERLLDESKTWKEKYSGLRSEVDSKEKEGLVNEGKTDELLTRAEQEKEEIAAKLRETRERALLKDLRFEVAKLAPDAHDLEDIVNSLDMEKLDYDKEELHWKKVAEEIDRVRKGKGHLFRTAEQMRQRMPGFDDTMSDADKYRTELRAAKSQKQLDAVRKKYGRDPNYA